MKTHISVKKVFALAICFAGLTTGTVNAQFEPQFTQYMFNEMFINPAYAGSRKQISATAVYRNQWVGLQGAPKTQTFSMHGPLMNQKLGVGLTVINENIGVTHEFAMYGNYAYRIQAGSNGAFAMGIQAGFINHQENLSEVIINEENDQEFLYNTPHVFLPNAGFGFYYDTDRFYAGISVPRIIYNDVAGNGTSEVHSNLDFETWHYCLATGYVFPVTESIKIKPSLLAKAVQGAPMIAEFTVQSLFREIFWLGVSYRTEDSFSGLVNFQISPQFRVGYSYDYTTTELNSYNNGTHEISIGYDFSLNKKKVVTPRYF